jgi:hypothetical protein
VEKEYRETSPIDRGEVVFKASVMVDCVPVGQIVSDRPFCVDLRRLEKNAATWIEVALEVIQNG